MIKTVERVCCKLSNLNQKLIGSCNLNEQLTVCSRLAESNLCVLYYCSWPYLDSKHFLFYQTENVSWPKWPHVSLASNFRSISGSQAIFATCFYLYNLVCVLQVILSVAFVSVWTIFRRLLLERLLLLKPCTVFSWEEFQVT